MRPSPQKFYLTTPIYYVNARPHIGHAYTTIVADVVARRHRLLGDDTWFLTGTDEHGQKIERSAAAAGIPPQIFADEVSASFRALWDRMGLTYDDYIRTSEPRHKQGVQKLFKLLEDQGKIYLSSYTGQYCVSEEMFVEGPPGTIGPDGRPTETVTEENYFFRLSDYQRPLLDLIESDTLRIQPEARKNEVLSFLRGNTMDRERWPELFEDSADGAYHTNEGLLQRHLDVRLESGELKKTSLDNIYIPGALKDLSVSRTSFTWGIPVPGNEKHVIYVWLDALANYMTAIGYGSDDPAEVANFEKFWPADLHIIGKEISRFHCIYWPAFLMAAGLPLPKAIVAHGWLLFEESKMSKSRGNIVRTETILDGFGDHYHRELVRLGQPEPSKQDADLFASDVLRYFLLREIPFGQDGSFSFDAMITRYNADLANGYGNLVSRVLKMIHPQVEGPPTLGLTPLVEAVYCDPNEMIAYGTAGLQGMTMLTARLTFEKELLDRDALTQMDGLRYSVDAYLSANAPWKLDRNDQAAESRRQEILYTAAESIRILTALLYPMLPYATAKVWAQLGLGSIEEAAACGDLKDLQWGGLQPGTKLGPLAPIFPRADKGLAQIMTDLEQKSALEHSATAQADSQTSTATEFAEAALASETVSLSPAQPTSGDPAAAPRTTTLPSDNPGAHVGASSAPVPELHRPPSHTEAQASGVFARSAASGSVSAAPSAGSPQITIDDFAKVELRVAKILVAERIPKADKLLRLEVDLGPELGQRQILSGIAEWYTPEELVGRKIVVITNLAPRKMRGLESHGMLLAASHGENGKPVLATFADEIEVGARLK